MTSASPRRGRKSAAWFRNTRTGSSMMSMRSISDSSLALEQRGEPLQRDVHPRRAVVELVAQLVEQLLQLGQLEQAARIFERRVQAARARGFGVRGDERLADFGLPGVE